MSVDTVLSIKRSSPATRLEHLRSLGKPRRLLCEQYTGTRRLATIARPANTWDETFR